MVRWIRKALVLSLAAVGVGSVQMIARILVAERRPERGRLTPISDGPLLIRGTPRVAASILEPHGAL